MTQQSSALRVSTLTPPGVGAMAVVRIAGADALGVLRSIFEPHGGKLPEKPDPQRLIYGRFLDRGETIDTGIVAVASAGPSGPIVDLTVHGGVRIVERIMALIQRLGGVIETTDRLNGTQRSLIETEALACLAHAKTRRAVRFLAFQLKALPAALEPIAAICEMNEAEGLERLAVLLERSRSVRYLVEGATIAFLGPVNAGKSTLVNRMFAKAQSLTSAQAGTTRDWVDTWAAIDGVPVRVIDTAGFRHDAEGLERVAIDRGLAQGAKADVRIFVLDASAPFPSAFVQRHRSIMDRGGGIIAVNKSDLSAAWEQSRAAELDLPVVATSGLTGQGTTQLAEVVLANLSIADLDRSQPALFTRRQIDWISQMLSGDIHQGRAEAIRSQLGSPLRG